MKPIFTSLVSVTAGFILGVFTNQVAEPFPEHSILQPGQTQNAGQLQPTTVDSAPNSTSSEKSKDQTRAEIEAKLAAVNQEIEQIEQIEQIDPRAHTRKIEDLENEKAFIQEEAASAPVLEEVQKDRTAEQKINLDVDLVQEKIEDELALATLEKIVDKQRSVVEERRLLITNYIGLTNTPLFEQRQEDLRIAQNQLDRLLFRYWNLKRQVQEDQVVRKDLGTLEIQKNQEAGQRELATLAQENQDRLLELDQEINQAKKQLSERLNRLEKLDEERRQLELLM